MTEKTRDDLIAQYAEDWQGNNEPWLLWEHVHRKGLETGFPFLGCAGHPDFWQDDIIYRRRIQRFDSESYQSDGFWQSIDTAPKDGSKILAFLPDGNELIVSWCGEQWQPTYFSCIEVQPTHWMPLPAKPCAPT